MDPFLGQIVMFGGNFAPRGWALCQGQLLAINTNTALFSILGTTYGGDGRTSFGLPDLRARVAVGEGNGPGVGSTRLGEKGGQSSTTIQQGNLPPINFSVPVSEDEASVGDPNGAFLAAGNFYASAGGGGSLAGAKSYGGNSQALENRPPYTVVNYIICTNGTFPSRN